MAKTTIKTYAVVLIEIEGPFSAHQVDAFHRWRRFVDRPSNMQNYGVRVVNWRIPSKAGFKHD